MISFNETAVAAEPTGTGAARQRLLTNDRVNGTRVLLDRITLKPGATMQFDRSVKSLAWLQMLEGKATLKTLYTDQLSNAHSVLLPPGFNTTLSTAAGASLLYAEIPDVGRIDPSFSSDRPHFTVVDWTREPVFACEHDARKRISLVTPDICATAAIKVEMVIYPAGSMSPNCHHEGADTFMYILSGRGTASANEQPFSVKQGDLIYFSDRERHYLKPAADVEMRFLEFHVPGEFKTVWADPGKISAWRSTGRDIHDWETASDAAQRRAYRYVFPFTN